MKFSWKADDVTYTVTLKRIFKWIAITPIIYFILTAFLVFHSKASLFFLIGICFAFSIVVLVYLALRNVLERVFVKSDEPIQHRIDQIAWVRQNMKLLTMIHCFSILVCFSSFLACYTQYKVMIISTFILCFLTLIVLGFVGHYILRPDFSEELRERYKAFPWKWWGYYNPDDTRAWVDPYYGVNISAKNYNLGRPGAIYKMIFFTFLGILAILFLIFMIPLIAKKT